MADDKSGEIHINIGNQTGGDHLSARDVSGEGIALGRQAEASAGETSRENRRRPGPRVYEDELIGEIRDLRQQISGLHTAINDLRAVNSTLQTKTALLDYQVSHLNDRLRQSGPPWGPAQWFVLAFILTVAAGVAVYVGLASH